MPEHNYTVREVTAEEYARAMSEMVSTRRLKYMIASDEKGEVVSLIVRDMAKPVPARVDMTAIIPLSRSRLDDKG